MKTSGEQIQFAKIPEFNVHLETVDPIAIERPIQRDLNSAHERKVASKPKRRAGLAWRACGTTLQNGFSMRAMAGTIEANNGRRSPRNQVPARNRCGTTHAPLWWYPTAVP